MTEDVVESGGSSDRSFSERVKALALTRPLHELDERKGLVTWSDARVYPMAELALHAIDMKRPEGSGQWSHYNGIVRKVFNFGSI
ncbi:hypothetical protein, partial [Actinocorallia libanotica]|uniref:hypothetical protein n=1 Tax=Actinocorallia libanotica TaxID=46162 RepID=UPI0031D12289